jgi:ribosome-binding factor A
MIGNKRVRDIKHAQRESFLLKELSELFLHISLNDLLLQNFYITRVELSPDRGHCTVFFHTPEGFSAFEEKLSSLILYKPSLRTALSKALHSRYTPELRFAYDEGIDKQNKIEDLFRKLEEEGKL